VFLALFWTINLQEAAIKIELIFKMDLEKRLSSVAKHGYTMLCGKSQLKSWKVDYV